MAKKKESKNSTQPSVFTTDNTTTGISIPSITQLLNRKTFERIKPTEPPLPPKKSKKKVEFNTPDPDPIPHPPPFFAGETQDPSPPLAVSVAPEGSEPKIILGSSSEENAVPANLKVQPIKKAISRNPVRPLLNWDLKTLRQNTDPMAGALVKLFDQGALCALFLVIGPPGKSGVPIFTSTAIVQGNDRAGVWSGLKWDPSVVPETWNQFVKNGFAELSPPGTSTNRNSNRNVVRLAFGIYQEEWLLLVRAGPLNHCRGVLAIVSKKSLADFLPKVLEQIQAQPDQKAA